VPVQFEAGTYTGGSELMFDYFQLYCADCGKTFPSVRATSAGELLVPDFEEIRECVGSLVSERFEDFHREHGGHLLGAVSADAVNSQGAATPGPRETAERRA
jgi:hypothetical protein